MGRTGYGPDIKAKAKAMWIVGNYSDQQIADKLRIPRTETIAFLACPIGAVEGETARLQFLEGVAALRAGKML